MSFLSKLFGKKGEGEEDYLSQPASPQAAGRAQVDRSDHKGIYPPGACIGRYEVVGKPLMGGMGIVYLCIDREAQRPVALKTFRPELLANRTARDSFLREGTTWIELGSHPHIVRCYIVKQTKSGEGVYLVLELVAKKEGHRDASLRSWLTPGNPLPPEEALLFALQIARGMVHATTCIPGLVHRDLKPENVLVGVDRFADTELNRLRVTDFGLAAVLEETLPPDRPATDSQPSRTQMIQGIVGTPLYMAPEQWRREQISTAVDVYALGCILYEMLVGRPAAEGNTISDLKRAHCAGQVGQHAGSLPAVLQDLLGRCLAVDAGKRYGGWGEVEGALGVAYTQISGKQAPTWVLTGGKRRADEVAAGWSYSEIGLEYLQLGKADVALGHFQRAVDLGQSTGEKRLEGAGLAHLGSAYKAMGQVQRALGYYEQHLAIARQIGHRQDEGQALGNLGAVYYLLGDVQRALGYYEQGLAIFREIGAQIDIAISLGNHGIAYRALGRPQRALFYFKQQLDLARRAGFRQQEASALGHLGNVYADMGQVRQAIEYYERQLAAARQIGNLHLEGVALESIGVAYRSLGDRQRMIDYVEKSLTIARQVGDRRGEAQSLGNLGVAYADLGQARRALEYYEPCLAIYRQMDDRRGEAMTLGNMGNVYDELGQAKRAIDSYEQALAMARQVGDRQGEVNHLRNLGLTLGQMRRLKEAISCYEQALGPIRELGDVRAEAGVSLNLAFLRAQQGKFRQALDLARRAQELSTRAGDDVLRQKAQRLAGRIRSRR